MKKLRMGRKKFIFLGVILFVVAAVLAGLFITREDDKPEVAVVTEQKQGCVNDEVGSLLGKNPQIFYTSELKLLQQAYDLSIKLPEETKSLSCYYVETTFLLNTGRVDEATKSFEKLDALYKIENAYPANIKNYAKSPEELKSLIDNVKAELERRKENYNGTPIEESEKVNASQGQ